MTMDPVKNLIQEHTAIAIMLGVIEDVISRLNRGEKVPSEDLDKVVEFLQIFADRCHHGKEEDYLFPALDGIVSPDNRDLIVALWEEHRQGREMIRRLAKSLADYKAGSDNAILELSSTANEYVILLRQHIEKENSRLFPEAEKVLSDEKQKILERGFEDIEEEQIGSGIHEKLHELLAELNRKYNPST